MEPKTPPCEYCDNDREDAPCTCFDNLPDFSDMDEEEVVPQCDLENVEYCEACQ